MRHDPFALLNDSKIMTLSCHCLHHSFHLSLFPNSSHPTSVHSPFTFLSHFSTLRLLYLLSPTPGCLTHPHYHHFPPIGVTQQFFDCHLSHSSGSRSGHHILSLRVQKNLLSESVLLDIIKYNIAKACCTKFRGKI